MLDYYSIADLLQLLAAITMTSIIMLVLWSHVEEIYTYVFYTGPKKRRKLNGDGESESTKAPRVKKED